MYAVQFDRFGPPEVLRTGSAPEPHAGPGQVRIRVRAAGVSPVDVALRAGRSPSRDRIPLPHIPGVDAAGVVDEVGPGAGAAIASSVPPARRITHSWPPSEPSRSMLPVARWIASSTSPAPAGCRN